VNKLLVGVRFFGDQVPKVGEELTANGKSVGQVTSAVFSPRLAGPLALALLRTSNAEPGCRVASASGEAEVVRLPLDK
jgi:glycine cleavage system aminomethyltransferase T